VVIKNYKERAKISMVKISFILTHFKLVKLWKTSGRKEVRQVLRKNIRRRAARVRAERESELRK